MLRLIFSNIFFCYLKTTLISEYKNGVKCQEGNPPVYLNFKNMQYICHATCGQMHKLRQEKR